MNKTNGSRKRGTNQVMDGELLGDFQAALADVLGGKDEVGEAPGCPDDNTLAAYADGKLSEPECVCPGRQRP